ncbi:MAG TPA: phosphate ABC transporter substrate-binding protein PstS [Frankiaceae bacterium]|nr:phosphate ABC transporter substrate-binding protein PstS [Frankiaceae bacterium]
MSTKRLLGTPAAILVLGGGLLGLTACGSDNNSGTSGANAPSAGSIPCGTGALTGAGSTFQKNIQLQWIKDYTGACSGAQVNYNGTGSGAGIQSFTDNQVDFAGSDSVMKPDEQSKANTRCGSGNAAIEYPVTAGAIIFTYNLPGVASLKLSPATLSGIFQGTIKTWNDPKIVADNPGVSLPSIPVQPVHRSDSSGSTDITSNFLDKTAGGDWKLGTGKELQWPGGQAAKGSDGVTAAVKSAAGGITYVEQSFAKANSLPEAQVKNGAGEFVSATGQSVGAALASAQTSESAGSVIVKADYATKAAGAYPVSAVSYVITCNKGNKAGPALKAYLTYATGKGQSSAEALGFAPLPDAIASKVQPVVAAIG